MKKGQLRKGNFRFRYSFQIRPRRAEIVLEQFESKWSFFGLFEIGHWLSIHRFFWNPAPAYIEAMKEVMLWLARNESGLAEKGNKLPKGLGFYDLDIHLTRLNREEIKNGRPPLLALDGLPVNTGWWLD